MSMSSRPVSLQAALILRRAQAAREQAAREQAAASRASASRKTGFSLRRFFGSQTEDAGPMDEVEPRKLAA